MMHETDLYRKATVRCKAGVLSPVNDTSRNMIDKRFPVNKNTIIMWDDRSWPHLKLFFAAIRNAYRNWPELYEFQPSNDEHLRAWLICKTGPKYRDVTDIHADNTPFMADGIRAALKKDDYAFVYPLKTKVSVVRPKSIAFKKLSQAKFNDLSESVSAVLLDVTGVSLDGFKNGEGWCERSKGI